MILVRKAFHYGAYHVIVQLYLCVFLHTHTHKKKKKKKPLIKKNKLQCLYALCGMWIKIRAVYD